MMEVIITSEMDAEQNAWIACYKASPSFISLVSSLSIDILLAGISDTFVADDFKLMEL